MWQGLAWYQGEVEISQYEGRKEFASLPLIPLEGHEHQGQFITRLGGRGQKFMNLASSSAQPKEYDRGALSRRECGCRGGGIEVEGRIMLGGEKDGLSPGDYKLLQRLQANHDDVFTSSSSSSESSSSQVPPTLTEDQLMYTSPVICAWSFKKEAWMDFDEFLTKPITSDSKTWRELKSTFRQCVRDFEGLVFFSSDRIQDLQPYLQGRISLQIDLSPLGPGQRERIWTSSVENSASRAGLRRYDLPKDKMEQLVRIDLSRKQIEKATERWYSSTGDDGLELEDLISFASEMQKVGRGYPPAHAEVDDDGYSSGSDENQMDDWTR
ncbi:putative AAA family ATPase [Metarhizium anisopliae]|nr:putative AAA family ATPase [Metarhizium anisopliae]